MQFEHSDSFNIIGSHTGRCYRVRWGKRQNIRRLKNDAEIATICFAPNDVDSLPTADVMLAQKIALETDEVAALKVKYQWPLSAVLWWYEKIKNI